jgi:hypothetical protein
MDVARAPPGEVGSRAVIGNQDALPDDGPLKGTDRLGLPQVLKRPCSRAAQTPPDQVNCLVAGLVHPKRRAQPAGFQIQDLLEFRLSGQAATQFMAYGLSPYHNRRIAALQHPKGINDSEILPRAGINDREPVRCRRWGSSRTSGHQLRIMPRPPFAIALQNRHRFRIPVIAVVNRRQGAELLGQPVIGDPC